MTLPLPARLAGAFAVAASIVSGTARADIIYVDDSAVGGANDGSSWANAFTDLQDALKAAQAGDEIRIGQGTYKPAPPGGDRAISFNLVSGVVMQGGYAGFGASDPNAIDPEQFPTILSGDLNGDDGEPPIAANYAENSYHVVRANAVAEGTRLRGVILQSGYANGIDYPHRTGGGLLSEGGGVLDIVDCTFMLNRGRAGPGAANHLSTMTVRGTTFLDNWCVPQDPGTGGGGIATHGPLVVEECWFEGNRGGLGQGGALSVSYLAEASVRSTTFLANAAENVSAGSGPATYVQCLFQSNGAQWLGTTIGGRFLNCTFAYNSGSESVGGAHLPILAVNCLFIGNSGAHTGGVTAAGDTALINCMVVGNRATSNQYSENVGGILLYQGWMLPPPSPRIENCIVWGNTTVQQVDIQEAQVTLDGTVLLQIHNSCVQGWTGSLGGVGNHGNDPRFVDADGPDNIFGTADDDPRLRANSPCINTGDSGLLPPDQFDLDDDGDTTEPLPIDLDGLPRVVGANVDMGAFEFQGTPCRADIDGNGSVAANDLLAVIIAWGPCVPGQVCNSDLDLDGEIAVNDLLMVITTWGDCPG